MATANASEPFILVSVGSVVVATRLYTRWSMVGFKGLALDDILMPMVIVVFGFEAREAQNVLKYKGLSNSSMTDMQRQMLSPDSKEYFDRIKGSQTQLIGWGLYTLTLWLLKACMAIFYSRLTNGIKNLRIQVNIAYAILFLTFTIIICVIYTTCHPFTKFWQIYPNPGTQCQPNVSKVWIITNLIFNISTDIYLLTIPLPVFTRSSLKWQDKTRLVVLFSGGIFIMVASIIRSSLLLTAGSNGPALGGSWSMREGFVAIVIGNIPMVYPLVRRIGKAIGLSATSSGDKSYSFNNKDSSGLYTSKLKFRNPLSTNKDYTHNVSDENIILSSRPDHTVFTTIDGNWDRHSSSSQNEQPQGGIKVVQETIIERCHDPR